MVFPVDMYGCESWTIKKAECQRIDAFEFCAGEDSWESLGTARRSNQSILKEISPGCSLEGLMLKLKLQYFGHLTWSANSLEKTLMLGKIKGRRRRGWQRMRWLDCITNSMDNKFAQPLGDGERQGSLACCSPWDCRVGHNLATERQQIEAHREAAGPHLTVCKGLPGSNKTAFGQTPGVGGGTFC